MYFVWLKHWVSHIWGNIDISIATGSDGKIPPELLLPITKYRMSNWKQATLKGIKSSHRSPPPLDVSYKKEQLCNRHFVQSFHITLVADTRPNGKLLTVILPWYAQGNCGWTENHLFKATWCSTKSGILPTSKFRRTKRIPNGEIKPMIIDKMYTGRMTDFHGY